MPSDPTAVRVYASSTHTATSWSVNVIGLPPFVSATSSKIFSTTLENLPMGIYEIQVTACYSYKFPDGSQFCQTKGKFVTFLLGTMPGTPGTIETSGSSPAQTPNTGCTIDTQRSVACNTVLNTFTVHSSRL